MIQNDLLIRNENVQRLFDWYNDGTFVVNRKYQRKLVWTFEEKQKFINSILLNYPVPLILLAATEDGKYEIIDGMQRLNAIFSFIKGLLLGSMFMLLSNTKACKLARNRERTSNLHNCSSSSA